ncbi:MAG: ComF family protein [Pseudomonadota bacterium]
MMIDRSAAKASPIAPRWLRAGLDALYPPTCLACEAPAEAVGGLCAECWRGVEFIAGRVCDRCGAPLVHEDAEAAGTAALTCDGCARWPPAWDRGRAAARYAAAARTLCLVLKHADRTEAAPPMARWMARAGAPLLAEADLLIPIPLHWTRRIRRRFNQSAELARAVSRLSRVPVDGGLLRRVRRTASQDGKNRAQRVDNLRAAFQVRDGRRLEGATVLLIDDVMTTGATLSAAAETLRPHRPRAIHALCFARVSREEEGLARDL